MDRVRTDVLNLGTDTKVKSEVVGTSLLFPVRTRSGYTRGRRQNETVRRPSRVHPTLVKFPRSRCPDLYRRILTPTPVRTLTPASL